MPVDPAAAVLALVRVLGPDDVAVAAGDEGELGEALHAAAGPVLPHRAVAVMNAWEKKKR